MEKKQLIIVFIVALLVIAPGSFYAGTKYQSSKNSSQSEKGQLDQRSQRRVPGQGSGNGTGFNRGGSPNGSGPNGDFVAGEVVSKDDKSITVKTRDGGSKIVFFADNVSVGKSVEGQVSDLENGKQVMISGKNNTDGTFSAQNIQIRPEESSQPQ